MARWTIYLHVLKSDGRRYVGITVNTMMHRWSQHCAQAKSSKGGRWHFPNAIRQYGKDAFSHHVLGVCHDVDQANLVEEVWILLLDTRNPEKGFNLAKGGSHVPHPVKNPWDRPEFREKALAANKRATSTSGFREKASQSAKALWLIPGMRERISLKNSQHVFTEEHRSKLAVSRTGVPINPEIRDKISAAQRGKPRDPDSIAKSAASRKGIVFSPEHRANIGAVQVGKKHSPEHVANVIAALRARPKKTHCKHGHSLEDAYVYSGVRYCRMCAAAKQSRYLAKKKAA